MEETGLFHLLEHRFIDEVDPDITFEIDIQIALDDKIADGVDTFWICIECVIEEKYDFHSICADEELDLIDDVFRTPHPHKAAPIYGRGAKVALERASSASHHIDGWKRPLSWDIEPEVVCLERNEMIGGSGNRIQVFDGGAGRI